MDNEARPAEREPDPITARYLFVVPGGMMLLQEGTEIVLLPDGRFRILPGKGSRVYGFNTRDSINGG